MFTFWYPERFNTLKKEFQNHIDEQKIEVNKKNSLDLLQLTDSAECFLHGIDILMNLAYWTHHVEDVTELLAQAKDCYVDQNNEAITKMRTVFQHIFNHQHFHTQLNAHLAQYALCTVIGFSSLSTTTPFPMLHTYLLYRGLVGLGCNYMARLNTTRDDIQEFIRCIELIQPHDNEAIASLFT